jgi:hypothetical protein
MMECYVRLDVLLRFCALYTVDGKGTVRVEREVPYVVSDIADCLVEFPHLINRVGFEAGVMSQHLFFGLTIEGFDVVCMKARQVNAALSTMRNTNRSKYCAPLPTSGLGKLHCSVNKPDERQIWAVSDAHHIVDNGDAAERQRSAKNKISSI